MNKIFVVIVNFHSYEKVKKLIQTIKPNVAKIIVVDNNKINRGFARGVNLGIKQALEEKADSILLLNPDIKISPAQVVKLEKTPGYIVGPILAFQRQGKKVFDFGGKVNLVLGRTTHLESTSLQEPASSNQVDLDPKPGEDHSRECDYLSGACMLIRREVFAKIGYFDEQFFLYFEDVDFCHRAKLARLSVAVNPNVVVTHKISEHKTTHDQFKLRQILWSNFLFINKWIPWYFKPFAYLYLLSLRLYTVSISGFP